MIVKFYIFFNTFLGNSKHMCPQFYKTGKGFTHCQSFSISMVPPEEFLVVILVGGYVGIILLLLVCQLLPIKRLTPAANGTNVSNNPAHAHAPGPGLCPCQHQIIIPQHHYATPAVVVGPLC